MKTLRKISELIIRFGLTFIFLLLLAFTRGDSKSEYELPIAAHSIFPIDFDMDGDIDIIIGHLTAWLHDNPTVTFLNNDSNGNFQVYDTSFVFCGYQENIFAINVNSDTLPDLVCFYSDFTSGSAERFVRIFYNEDGDFNIYADFPLNTSATLKTINYGDFNGDGFYDLCIISNVSHFWGVLYNDGIGNFSDPTYFNTPDYNPTNICCGDLNYDGRDDIVISSAMKTEIFFSLENGFQPISFYLSTGDIETVDLDNDGDLDIISHRQPLSNFSRITFFENLGNENFSILPFFDFQPKCNYMTISDFNNDSFPDILLHTQDAENLLIFYNEGNFELSEFQLIPLINYGETIRKSTCADFDGNGYNDIATIRGGAIFPNINIFYNDGNGNYIENPIFTETEETKTNNSQLFSCYPNPFHSEINIKFQLNESSFAEIYVYNFKGELIIVLTHQQEKGGNYSIKWDGLDDGGNPCKPGSYLLTFKVNGIGCKPIKIIKF
jgi:hypothetical protein